MNPYRRPTGPTNILRPPRKDDGWGSPPMVTRNISTARLLGVANPGARRGGHRAAIRPPCGRHHHRRRPDLFGTTTSTRRVKKATGQGGHHAILDGDDISAPELAGADTDKSPRTVTSSKASITHGTAMASLWSHETTAFPIRSSRTVWFFPMTQPVQIVRVPLH